MNRRTVVVVAASLVAAGAVASLAGPAFYRDVMVAPAPQAPAVSDAAAPGAAIAPSAVQGVWHVGDGSYAGYRVDEVLGGTDVTVVGRTDRVEGTVTVDGGALTAASFTVDVASITTDSGSRDSYFRNTAMQTFRHPSATFVLTEPVRPPSAPRRGAAQSVVATGELSLAGVTRTVAVRLDAMFDGERARVAGTIPIAFGDYGIEPPNLGFVRVADAGSVEFSLTLVR
jgi:polyisoprenoid-binding protein YceI